MREHCHVSERVLPAEEPRLTEGPLQLAIGPLQVAGRGRTDLRELLVATHLDDGDGVQRGIKLSVREILDEPAFGAEGVHLRIERRRRLPIFEVLTDYRLPWRRSRL